MLAQASNGPEVAVGCLARLQRFMEVFFKQPQLKE